MRGYAVGLGSSGIDQRGLHRPEGRSVIGRRGLPVGDRGLPLVRGALRRSDSEVRGALRRKSERPSAEGRKGSPVQKALRRSETLRSVGGALQPVSLIRSEGPPVGHSLPSMTMALWSVEEARRRFRDPSSSVGQRDGSSVSKESSSRSEGLAKGQALCYQRGQRNFGSLKKLLPNLKIPFAATDA